MAAFTLHENAAELYSFWSKWLIQNW